MGPFVLLAISGPLAVAGMSAAVYGRIGLHRAGDTYRGTGWAWAGYLGGILLTALGVVALAWSIGLAVTTWMS